jgi:ribonuclease-3
VRKLLFKIKRLFLSQQDKKLCADIYSIIGTKPHNLELYKLSLTQQSNYTTYSNERLEYLGDAVLGMIVAEYLFSRFPTKNEGFLTQVRSRIVNREHLNSLCQKIGLADLIKQINTQPIKGISVYGNTLEAFIGAIYLDKGLAICRKFIVQRLLLIYTDIDAVIQNDLNYKSKLLEWTQRNNQSLDFRLIATNGRPHQQEFIIEVLIDSVAVAKGSGFNKKKAEQAAAEKACQLLEIISA